MKKLLTFLAYSNLSIVMLCQTVVSCGTTTPKTEENSNGNESSGDKFELDKQSIEGKIGEKINIKITNYDELNSDSIPSIFKFSEEGFATAELDSSNKQIVVSLIKQSTTLKLNISSINKNEVSISIKISAEKIDLTKDVKVRQFIAGNKLDDGSIDTTQTIGQKGYIINNISIIDSLNNINGLALDINQLNIINVSPGDDGVGAIYNISAKDDAPYTGKVTITLNQNVDPLLFFANKDLGNMYIYKGAFNKINDVIKDEKDKKSIASIAFENLGATNKDLEYLKNTLLQFSEGITTYAQELLNTADLKESSISFKVPTMGNIFKPNNTINLNFKYVEDNRATLYDNLLSENKKIKVSKDLLESNTTEKALELKKLTYKNLNESFKNKVNETEFINYTKIKYASLDNKESRKKVTKIDILPGSNLMYGHDGGAFNSYIESDAIAGNFTHSGKLSNYEENKKLDIKYTIGMGWFEIPAAMSGEFYQGYDIYEAE
ncbi:hypothetical protein SCORR_v1c06490 [Spiroplasma corruscae]|uniref:Lipoprotein n=1 Tax=Spiroplasma corruscae TaxID=216934 RepID=A0A222EPY1_9MOLU|nr:hypothetical protein [Spiroplasma corruscae]ASP28421.1 hypothetical protein SCORR_v1c06490 [Spiroplasma corruscae]